MNNGCGKIAKHVMPMNLRRYRDAAGLPQQQLADYGEAIKAFISALEGGHSVPNVDMLITRGRSASAPANCWTPLWTKRKKEMPPQ